MLLVKKLCYQVSKDMQWGDGEVAKGHKVNTSGGGVCLKLKTLTPQPNPLHTHRHTPQQLRMCECQRTRRARQQSVLLSPVPLISLPSSPRLN